MSSLKYQYVVQAENIEAPPPSYDLVTRSPVAYAPTSTVTPQQAISYTSQPSSNAFKPIVIPQTSKSFRGAFFSPFCRAWAPALAQADISQVELLTFIDGLNEAFIANPAFQITSIIGGVMTVMPHPINFAGIGLQVGAGFASTATSWARARSFVQDYNKNIFEPVGLKAKVLKTKKMMVAVGDGRQELELPALSEIDGAVDWEGEENNPRMRRIRALGGRVAELEFNGLPEPEEMSNWWKKMGSRQAQKRDRKTYRKLIKEREKGQEEMDKVEEEARKFDKDIAKIEREKEKEVEKANRKIEKKGGDSRKAEKVEDDLEKELRKLDKDLNKVLKEKDKKVGEKLKDGQKEMRKAEKKEGKIAQKIYWIVIDKLEAMEQEFPAEDDVESLESK